MSASIKPLTVEEFLAWEREQPDRYEFDGVQPIGPMGMTGGSSHHERLIARIITAASNRVVAPCEVFASGLKVISQSKVRYPDVTIGCGPPGEDDDAILPTVIFEVLSPSTALADRRVKSVEYATVPSVLVYVVAAQDRPELNVRRRSTDWVEETLVGTAAILTLPEIGIEIPLSELYR